MKTLEKVCNDLLFETEEDAQEILSRYLLDIK